jgi:hypothetical protein
MRARVGERFSKIMENIQQEYSSYVFFFFCIMYAFDSILSWRDKESLVYLCLSIQTIFFSIYVFLIRLFSSSRIFMYITKKITMNGVKDQEKY